MDLAAQVLACLTHEKIASLIEYPLHGEYFIDMAHYTEAGTNAVAQCYAYFLLAQRLLGALGETALPGG